MKYTRADYGPIDQMALEIRADYGFFDKNLDVFALAQCLNINLIPYSSLTEEQISYLRNSDEFDEDGLTIMIRSCDGEWSFYTFYNDNAPFHRQRFTIAHEIKHVVFLETDPSEKDEAMADHFARYLLAPSFWVMEYLDKYVIDISVAFGISVEAAQYAYVSAKNRVEYGFEKLTQYEIEFIESSKRQ